MLHARRHPWGRTGKIGGMALMLAGLMVITVLVEPLSAQGRGPYSLTGSAAGGGGGASSGAGFSLRGSAGQPETQELAGGSFGLTGGYEQPECAAGAAQAVAVTAGHSGAAIMLSWTHQPANAAYEIHGAASPFFTPGSGTMLKTEFAPAGGYTDEDGVTEPVQNRFYLVRGRCGGLWADSNRTGLFAFQVVPGR